VSSVGDGVGVGQSVLDTFGFSPSVGEAVAVGQSVAVGLGVGDAEGAAVGVGDTEGVSLGDGCSVGSCVTVGVGVGATVATGAVATWSALDTKGAFDSYKSDLPRLDQTEANRRVEDGHALETRSNVLWAVTGALAVGTVALGVFVVDWAPSKETAVVIGPGAAALRGRF